MYYKYPDSEYLAAKAVARKEQLLRRIQKNNFDEITLNLRSLSKNSRFEILHILECEQETMPDDDNYTAILILNEFKDE